MWFVILFTIFTSLCKQMRKPSNSAPRGFTLVELLVVIAIIGVLVALLLPAVQAAREAARRTSCVNKLKQVGLAMHNYHDVMNAFPPAQYNLLATDGRPNRVGWAQSLLPFMEQSGLYDSFAANIKANTGGYSWVNRHSQIPTLSCPSDPGSGKVLTAGQTAPTSSQGFHTNYVVCGGSTVFGNSGQGNALNGSFYCLSDHDMSSITDGTSNTLMAAEILLVKDTSVHDLRGRMYNSWQGNTMFSTLQSPNTTVGDVSSYCIATPQAPCASLSTSNVVQYARSMHPGGVNVTLMDASTRFLPDTINITTYRNLGNRNDGLVLGAF